MTITDQINNIDKLLASIESEFPIMFESLIANDLRLLITQRIISGVNSKGEKFSPYSTNPIYINTSKNSPKKLRGKGKHGHTVFAKTGQPHQTTYFMDGYLEFRDKIGRSTDKNFELTGEMLRGFGLVDVIKEPNQTTVVLAGTTEIVQKKLDGNSEREGYSIIDPSQEEIEAIENELQQWIEKLVEQTLNAA